MDRSFPSLRRPLGVLSLLVPTLILLPLTLHAVEDPDVATLERTSKAFARVAKGAIPAVVFIKVEKKVSPGWRRNPRYSNDPFDMFAEEFFERFFRHRLPRRHDERYVEIGQGSGFIVSPKGYILTNHHVVGEGDRFQVILYDGRKFSATFIGSDPESDVAVIQIDGKDLPILPMGDSDRIDVGEWVIAIGNPFGLSHTITVGVVSAKGRSGMGINDYEDFIQTDAAINPGNSGGPLINIRGEAVGISTAIFSKSGGYMGIGFAIPINMARVIERQIVNAGGVTRGYLGVTIQELTNEIATSLGLDTNEGVLIVEVVPDSPADKAGLRRGDVVLTYGGKRVESPAHFRNMVALSEPNKPIEIVVFRDGKRIKKQVRPSPLEEPYEPTSRQIEMVEHLGFMVTDLTKTLADRLGYEAEGGVVVSEVYRGTLAHLNGLRPGMLIRELNRKPVPDTKTFFELLEEAISGHAILLLVQDGSFTKYVVLKLR
ncbi:MAG: Do family serine endopeptidase [Deltaproteobacteria bacterium]|nr:MAG: Do family serine endopeptidase [Deltaproteobacteria bacterium]